METRKTYKLACIGSGNMGSALMMGALRLRALHLHESRSEMQLSLIITNRTAAKGEALVRQCNELEDGSAVFCADNAGAVRDADFVFLAVKPAVIAPVLREIAPVLREIGGSAAGCPILVSMAAGVTIANIGAELRSAGVDGVPIIQIMPNTPCQIGKGIIALSAAPDVDAGSVEALSAILSGAGTVIKLEERLMSAAAALSGCGPAFVAMFIEALSDGGVAAGLPRAHSVELAATTVLGTAALVLETGKHPAELKDAVCSPGGTTIEGVRALEAGSFRSAVIEAVQAAYKKAGCLEKGNTD
ncbi:pyrroline-5-carboxylate reductase [Betaproteobacteria bacterium]|nr:pyrroline-5-carboxylate reductase [Betaproteobacteria bacterium]